MRALGSLSAMTSNNPEAPLAATLEFLPQTLL